jgi:FAD:protein FMN transferase
MEVQVSVEHRASGPAAESAILAEVARLERVFSVFLPSSELLGWAATFETEVPISADLADALEAAERWRVVTRGAFDPRIETETRHWRELEKSSTAATGEPGGALVPRGEGPLWAVSRTRSGAAARKLTPEPVTLNALAKGMIIDRACEAAASVPGVREALVNIGGDLRHIGERPIVVGIADPFVDAENAPPMRRAAITGQGFATSGAYRRGFRLSGGHRSHIIDPRTGEPADEVVSASVIAPTAADADALATAFSVLRSEESIEMADSLPGVSCLIVTIDRRVHTSRGWPAAPA